jgi:hypothetical protein
MAGTSPAMTGLVAFQIERAAGDQLCRATAVLSRGIKLIAVRLFPHPSRACPLASGGGHAPGNGVEFPDLPGGTGQVGVIQL